MLFSDRIILHRSQISAPPPGTWSFWSRSSCILYVGASKQDGAIAKSVGDIAKGLSQGEKIDGEFELPFLAHAPMEPMNCTVRLTPGACEIWTGTQVMTRVQEAAAKAAGVPLDTVTVHNHLLGGGFGRRLEADMVDRSIRSIR